MTRLSFGDGHGCRCNDEQQQVAAAGDGLFSRDLYWPRKFIAMGVHVTWPRCCGGSGTLWLTISLRVCPITRFCRTGGQVLVCAGLDCDQAISFSLGRCASESTQKTGRVTQGGPTHEPRNAPKRRRKLGFFDDRMSILPARVAAAEPYHAKKKKRFSARPRFSSPCTFARQLGNICIADLCCGNS